MSSPEEVNIIDLFSQLPERSQAIALCRLKLDRQRGATSLESWCKRIEALKECSDTLKKVAANHPELKRVVDHALSIANHQFFRIMQGITQ